MPEIGLFDAMYSARALRPLKPDPVPQEIITVVSTPPFARRRPAMRKTGRSSSCATRSNGAGWA
jgi:hypothetical protein